MINPNCPTCKTKMNAVWSSITANEPSVFACTKCDEAVIRIKDGILIVASDVIEDIEEKAYYKGYEEGYRAGWGS